MNLVSTFSWLCTTYSWLVQNLFTTYSQTFTTCYGLVKDFFKTCSHFSQVGHVLFRTCSFEPLHDLFIIGSQLGHNLFMICSCSQLVQNIFMTCSQLVLKLFTSCSQLFATLGSILESQLSWESGKFQLARWSHNVALLSWNHPPTRQPPAAPLFRT